MCIVLQCAVRLDLLVNNFLHKRQGTACFSTVVQARSGWVDETWDSHSDHPSTVIARVGSQARHWKEVLKMALADLVAM
jgi:hypothetical protein